MSLHVRFRFDGRCCVHPRYNPENDGRPKDNACPGCESLYVIWLYSGIAQRKAENGEGLARQAEVEPSGDGAVHVMPEATATTLEADPPPVAEGQTP